MEHNRSKTQAQTSASQMPPLRILPKKDFILDNHKNVISHQQLYKNTQSPEDDGIVE